MKKLLKQSDTHPKLRIYQISPGEVSRRWSAGDRQERGRIDAMLERQRAQICRWEIDQDA
jgi:hypothetical protein